MVKNLPAMRETQVQSMGWEDPLEKGMATHSSILGHGIVQARIYNGVKTISLTSGAGKTGQPLVKE